MGVFSTWIIEVGLALVHTTASGTSSIMQAPNNNLSKQVHKLLTIQVLNKKTLEYVARKLRTSIDMPFNVMVMFKLVGASFASNINTSLECNCHKSLPEL